MLEFQNTLINLQNMRPLLILKIVLLVIIGVYAIFTFQVFVKIRALKRIVVFTQGTPSNILQYLGLLYFLLVLSLFFLTLVIV